MSDETIKRQLEQARAYGVSNAREEDFYVCRRCGGQREWVGPIDGWRTFICPECEPQEMHGPARQAKR